MTVHLDPNAIKISKILKAAQHYDKSNSNEKHSALLQFFSESAVAKYKAVWYVSKIIFFYLLKTIGIGVD